VSFWSSAFKELIALLEFEKGKLIHVVVYSLTIFCEDAISKTSSDPKLEHSNAIKNKMRETEDVKEIVDFLVVIL
jgi:hypothetical protein